MRTLLIVAAAFAAGTLLSLVSANAESASFSDTGFQGDGAGKSAPTFDDCFRLAWVRGVHVERYELGDFNAECMANRIPFDSGNPVTSVKRGVK